MSSSFASALQARQQAMVLPEDPPWWELFNATKDEITVVSKTILTLYAYVHWIVFLARRRLHVEGRVLYVVCMLS
jgi:hypothetical protein